MADLFGEDEAPKLQKPKRPKKQAGETDPAVKHCIDEFHARFRARFGFVPLSRGYGRFGKELQLLLASWGEGEVLELIGDFFRTTDPMILRSNYEPADFARLAQRLKLRRNGNSAVEGNTAVNIDAGVRATQRRRVVKGLGEGDGDPSKA